MSGGYPLNWEVCNGTDNGTNTSTSLATSVANSGTLGVYGSFTPIVASTAADAGFILINIENASGGFLASNNIAVEIAVGAAASEVVVIADLLYFNGGSSAQSASYVFPIDIPAGTRISAAAAGSSAGADSINVQVTLFDGSFTQIEGCAGVDSIGVTAAKGTAMTPGAANVKGAFAPLTASTPRDYLGFCLAVDGSGTSAFGSSAALIDVAIGASSSEIVILPNYMLRQSTGGMMPANGISPVFPIQIPAGTRVSARVQNVAGSGNVGLSLYGIYQ